MFDFTQFVPSDSLISTYLQICGLSSSEVARMQKAEPRAWGMAKESVPVILSTLFSLRMNIVQSGGCFGEEVAINREGVMTDHFSALLLSDHLLGKPEGDLNDFMTILSAEIRVFVQTSCTIVGVHYEVIWQDGEVVFAVLNPAESIVVEGWTRAESLDRK